MSRPERSLNGQRLARYAPQVVLYRVSGVLKARRSDEGSTPNVPFSSTQLRQGHFRNRVWYQKSLQPLLCESAVRLQGTLSASFTQLPGPTDHLSRQVDVIQHDGEIQPALQICKDNAERVWRTYTREDAYVSYLRYVVARHPTHSIAQYACPTSSLDILPHCMIGLSTHRRAGVMSAKVQCQRCAP